MVAIVDYKMGNLHSVQKACAQVGLNSRFVSTAKGLREAKAVILPGVGAFGKAMENLTRMRLVNALKQVAASGKPFLGICLGMQLLFEKSEEFGTHQGLGIFKGEVRPFPKKVVVPHMGWNQLNFKRKDPLFEGIKNGTYMYFVHSYYCDPKEQDIILATTDYGQEITSVVGRDNIRATQFHPEKSQTHGLKVYHNLARLLMQ